MLIILRTQYKHPETAAIVNGGYEHHTKTRSWTRLPDLQKRRRSLACVCVNKKVYAIGGWNQDDEEMLDLSVTQPAWTTRMKHQSSGCGAARETLSLKVDSTAMAESWTALRRLTHTVKCGSQPCLCQQCLAALCTASSLSRAAESWSRGDQHG